MPILINLFVIGFTAAALPGAVQTTIFLSTLQSQTKTGFKVALGAALMDGLYLFLAYYGIVQFITAFTVLKTIIGLLGFSYMLWLGISGLKTSLQKTPSISENLPQRGFFSGMVLVLLHIPTLLYFIGVASGVLPEQLTPLFLLLGVLSLFVGALICFLLVILIAWFSKLSGKRSLIQALQIISALVLIAFALKLLVSLLS